MTPIKASLFATTLLVAAPAWSAEAAVSPSFVTHWVGYACLALFVLAYVLVVMEEWIGLRKSVPVLIAATLIWALIGWVHIGIGDYESVEASIRHSLLEYCELFLFLLAAMTYINTLEERQVFDALHSTLVSRGFSLRAVFWITGLLSFFISPVADNMTTALVMSSVALAVGQGQPRFITLACINIVVAANAGGAWSPFGDITTLMVWQKGVLSAPEFLDLFVPSLVNWLVPAALMSLAVPKQVPNPLAEKAEIRPGGFIVIFMFIGTIAATVTLHSKLHLPPVLGMMGGLGMLKLFGWWLNRRERNALADFGEHAGTRPDTAAETQPQPFNIFREIARAEWDTLLFFYGIILCVGGLGQLGYLAVGSRLMYVELGPTVANVLVGVVSSIVDNIPVMYAVLTMNPSMSDGQWLLVTMTAGVGGSLLSIGSAAGVAVMGHARGSYTFFSHLRWAWAIALGYAAGIVVHFLINTKLIA